MPSIAELVCLFKNRTIVNTVLTALGGNTHNTTTWSSSQHDNGTAVWVISESMDGFEVNAIYKKGKSWYRVVPVRK